MALPAPADLTAGLLCPVCYQPLASGGAIWRCPAGHAFDTAREGYVNLLRPTGRPARIQGDTRPMLQARRRFLEQGHFDPLLERLAARIARHAPPHPWRMVEAGCGEGYFIGRLAARFPSAISLGFDYARDAGRLAARRYPGVQFFIADVNRRLLLEDASVTILLSLFAPRQGAEFARILRPAGRLLVVIPRPEHLAELRAHYPLLRQEADKRARLEARLPAFTVEASEEITYPLSLTPEATADWLAMTPNAWHQTQPLPRPAGPLSVQASFELVTLRLAAGAGCPASRLPAVALEERDA